MATIKISDLHSAGSELFMDSESYLNELTDEELNTHGSGITITTSSAVCVSIVTLASVVYSVISYAATIYTRRA